MTSDDRDTPYVLEPVSPEELHAAATATTGDSPSPISVVLGTNLAYVGFTSGTGAAGGYHDIVNWQFRDNFAPINETPEPGSLALLGIAGLALGLTRRRRA